MGDLSGAIGDFSNRVGLAAWAVEVEMLKDNLGLADREASMLMVVCLIIIDLDLGRLEV